MITKTSFSIWYAILTKWATILVHDLIQALNRIEEPPSSRFRTPATTARRRVPLAVAFCDSVYVSPYVPFLLNPTPRVLRKNMWTAYHGIIHPP